MTQYAIVNSRFPIDEERWGVTNSDWQLHGQRVIVLVDSVPGDPDLVVAQVDDIGPDRAGVIATFSRRELDYL